LQLTRPDDTVATFVSLEVQVAVAVTFLLAPDANVPIAVSCVLPPARISHFFSGVTLMYLSCGAWQVTLIEALMLSLAAVTVEEPFTVAPALQVTRPAADTVATPETLELHWTVFVTVCAGPEEKLPVAVNCAVPPVGRVSCEGAIVMDLSTGAKQVTVVEPVAVPVAVAPVAEIVAYPLDVDAALQLTKPADTVATLGALETQAAVVVRFFVEPSVKEPVAVNCVAPPAATCGAAGVTLMEASAMTFTVACVKLVMLLPAAAEHISWTE
jgi:hypothetical protein